MKRIVEPVLYIDPQKVTALRCCRCGGAVYPPGYQCLRCGREEE